LRKDLDINKLKSWIAENKTEQALDELKASETTISDKAFQNQITLLNARWEKLETDQIKGLLADEDYRLQLNNINNSLLNALDNLKSGKDADSNITNEAATPKRRPKWQKILAAIAASIAVLAGIAEITGYSIRDCFAPKEDNIMPIVNPNELENFDNESKATCPASTDTFSSIMKKIEETVIKRPKITPTTKLQIDIKTQKGKENLVFNETEEVQVFFKVNKSCKLRTIYKLADGNLILLDNDRQINAPETNHWVQLSDDFEVAPPFGAEELYIFAAEINFPVLQTKQEGGYTLIIEGLPNALRKTRGLKKKQTFAESKLNITTQQNKIP